MVARSTGSLFSVARTTFLGFILPFLIVTSCPPRALAASYDDILLDASALAALEQQAASAQPREQVYLYTEVVHGLAELAGKQLAEGQESQAQLTLQHMQAVSAKMHQVLLKDAKKLKNAEQLMEHTTRRLADMLHLTSSDMRPKLQLVLQKLNEEHTAILNEVFSR